MTSFIELALRKTPEELTTLLNEHLETRMFLVGHSITAADLTVFSHLASHFVISFVLIIVVKNFRS